MSTETIQSAKRLLNCIGAIADSFLEETKLADETAKKKSKKRIITYSAIGVGVASVGITIAALLLRPKRVANVARNALPKSA